MGRNRGGKEKDNKRLTMTFSKCCYKKTVDIRILRRLKETETFVPTSHGFCLTNNAQPKYLSHIEKLIDLEGK